MSRATYQNVLVGALGALLVGCGGGSSSSDLTSDDNDPSLATVSGRAAVGAPIAGAPVDARCADGSGFTNNVATDNGGRFEGQVESTSMPCALRVNGGSAETTLHSYAGAAGNVNITPLTDLIIAVTTSISPVAWYEQSDRTERVQGLDAVREDFLAELRSQGFEIPSDDFDPFRTIFAIGDSADRLLDSLMEAIDSMENVDDYTAFVDLMSSGNLASIPPAPGKTGDGGEPGNGGDPGDGGDPGNGGDPGSGGDPGDDIGSGGGGSLAACVNELLYQEGTILEQTQGTINPISGDLSEDVIHRQEVGGLTNFRGDTARVINSRTVSNSITPLTLYSRQYQRLDLAALEYQSFGSEALDGENGAVTNTYWTEPPAVTRLDLAPGESYQQIYTSYNQPAGGEAIIESNNDLTTTYYGRETVTVPAGTFETCKLFVGETGSHGGWTSIVWVSVGDGIDVQGGLLNSDGTEMITTQLQSYSINGVQQAP